MFAFAPELNLSGAEPMPPSKRFRVTGNQVYSFMNNSNKEFSSQKGWTLTRYGRGLDLKKLVNTHKTIGKISKHGSVTRLSYDGNPHMFVMKTIPFKNNNSRVIFDTEIRVGQLKNINQVGTRVVAWRKLETKGQYIMENVEKAAASTEGNEPVRVLTLSQFKHSNPRIFENFIKGMFIDVLARFHRITGGDHGDLHSGNILVIIKGRKVYIKIIDYGAFRLRKNLVNRAKKVSRYYNMNVYNVGNGQHFIYNSNSLKNLLRTNARGVSRRVRTSLSKVRTNVNRRSI
jgi:hypothetical protein